MRGRERGTDARKQLHEWDAEGWCSLVVFSTIYAKLTIPWLLAADCIITMSSAGHDFLPQHLRKAAPCHGSRLWSFQIHQHQKQNPYHTCSCHVSEQTWALQSGQHPFVSPGRKDTGVNHGSSLSTDSQMHLHTCCADLGCLRMLRPAAVLFAVEVVEY